MIWIKIDKKFRDAIKSGSLIKLKDGSILLVGTVNENLGYCDCCPESNAEYYSNDLIEEIENLKNNHIN